MRVLTRLPLGYTRIRRIDLIKNRDELTAVTLLSLALPVVMLAVMALFLPFNVAGEFFAERWWSLLLLAGAVLAYIPLHELVHGLVIHLYSGRRAKYGFSFTYAWAGSDCFFPKGPYLAVALAPVLFWGAVLAVIQALAPLGWAWWVYLLQMVNVSGAAGDLYTVWVTARLPEDILVRDSGTAMEIFAPRNGAPRRRRRLRRG